MRIGLCGYTFDVKNRYSYIEKQCHNFIVDSQPDYYIECSEEEIKKEAEFGEDNVEFSPEMGESLAVYRKICFYLASKDIFLMHSAIIEVDGKAVAFLAQSGVGKSTHIRNWRKAFGEKVGIVNGDKPLIQKKDGKFYAWGTPWAGKEGWHRNTVVPLYALCFLSRAENNSCEKKHFSQVADRIFTQVYLPDGELETIRIMDNMDQMLKSVNIFEVKCNKEMQSAEIAYSKIFGEGNEIN